MRDLLLQCAGLAAIAVAVIHGVLARQKCSPAPASSRLACRSQTRSVFFEALGVWTSADPVLPKERIMQGEVYGALREWNYTGSDTLKMFSMMR
jgi:hypothetical protein